MDVTWERIPDGATSAYLLFLFQISLVILTIAKVFSYTVIPLTIQALQAVLDYRMPMLSHYLTKLSLTVEITLTLQFR